VRSPTLEQLILLAVVVLIPVVNVLARWLRRLAEHSAARPPAPEADVRPVLRPPAARPTRPPSGDGAPRRQALAPAPEWAARPRSRLGPSEIRRAVVMMTILGSCPGLDDPAREWSARPPSPRPR
jgi:hypothetical protein